MQCIPISIYLICALLCFAVVSNPSIRHETSWTFHWHWSDHRIVLSSRGFLVITATSRNGQNRNGHKPKRPHTGAATNWNGHKPKRPQTKTATNRNDHKPKRPQTEWTQIISYKLYRSLKSCWFLGQFFIRFFQMHSCFVVYMHVIMEHCRLFPDWVCWSFYKTLI